MTTAFQTGFRSTHGFPLLLALAAAAMIGFLAQILPSPQTERAPAPEPEQPPALVVVG